MICSILTHPIIQMAIGVLIGGFITLLVARHYYKRATKDLEKEGAKLRNLIDLIITLIGRLEKSDLLKVTRDDSGNVTGLKVLTIHVHN